MDNIAKFYRFHMTGCGHCVNMEKDWNNMTLKMSEKYKDKIVIKDINAVDKDNFEGGKSVNSFPTMVYVLNGNVEKYEGGRSEKDLIKWVESKMRETNTQKGGQRKNRKINKLRKSKKVTRASKSTKKRTKKRISSKRINK